MSVPSTPAAKPFDYYSLDSRGWSIDYVREGLGINQKRYSHIAAEVEKRMREAGLGGSRTPRGPNTRAALDTTVHAIIDSLEAEFRAIPKAWLYECFQVVARRCGRNVRRRQTRLGKTSTTQPSSQTRSQSVDSGSEDPTSQSRSPSKPPQRSPPPDQLETEIHIKDIAVVVTTRKNIDLMLCGCSDLVKASSSAEDIKVDDLSFEKFMSIMKREMGYNEKKESIVYSHTGWNKVVIQNELGWHAALVEMLANGQTRFYFQVADR